MSDLKAESSNNEAVKSPVADDVKTATPSSDATQDQQEHLNASSSPEDSKASQPAKEEGNLIKDSQSEDTTTTPPIHKASTDGKAKPTSPQPKRRKRMPHWSELNSATMASTYQDPSQELFSRGVAALLDSRKINVTHSAFDHLILIAEEYLCGLIEELKKAAKFQRRLTPSISDVLILLRLSGLEVGNLDEEYEKEQKMPTILPQEWNDIELDMLPVVDHDSTELFMAQRGSDVASLIPSRKERGAHIPSWMPPFPPDHTFMTTPSLPERVTDPRALREMIVQEGQLAEQALRRLTGVIEVDENAAQDDEDDATAVSANVDKPLQIEEPPSSADTSLAKSEPGTASTSSPSQPVGLNGSAAPRPVLALKLSLGGSSSSPTENGHTATTTNSATSTQDINNEPSSSLSLYENFNSKRFDVVDYAQKRLKLARKWEAQEEARLERQRVQAARQAWLASLGSAATTDPASASTSATADSFASADPLAEDKDPHGVGAALSIVEHEYNMALAKIQKSKDDEAKKESIVDTGVVNWERDRYTWT